MLTTRGVASYRAIQALYQAWRLSQIARVVGGDNILEVGAGLGRNAYYASRFGLTNFTIVDIPTTQMAQGYYLGRVLGPDGVCLQAESGRGVRLRSPKWLQQTREAFDVMLNADSLTEMDRDHASGYVGFASDRTKAFLSINHEANPASVCELFQEKGLIPIARSPCWSRAGYVEELFICSLGRGALDA